MENLFNEWSVSEYTDGPFEVARGRTTLPRNNHALQHETASNSPEPAQTPNSFNHDVSTASTVMSDYSTWSQSSSSSSSYDPFRQLTREILNLPVFQSTKETGSSLAPLEPTEFNPMHIEEVPIVYDRLVKCTVHCR
jgi:hypothetical protein